MQHVKNKRVYDFNPRSRGGNDSKDQPEAVLQSNFNPRSRVGNDDDTPNSFFLSNNFNPRSRGGNDETFSSLLFVAVIFQSTFPRGERP